VEKYIAECLDSLYAQDIPEEEYEVICVNDCSPDGTRDIILYYQKKHDNLLLIDHEVNKKQGGARNTGLEAARGEYIWFVDPDDYIEKNILKKLLNELIQNQLDVLVFDYIKFDSNNNHLKIPEVNFYDEIILGISVFDIKGYYYLTALSWSRIIKRDFLFKNKLFFYEDFYLEDVIFGIKCFLKAEQVKQISLNCYFYRVTSGSVMNSDMNGLLAASYLKLGLEYYKLSTEVSSEILRLNFFDNARYYLKSVVKQILYLNNRERKFFYSSINKIGYLDNIKKIYVNKLLQYELSNRFFICVSFIVCPVLLIIRTLFRKINGAQYRTAKRT
jgi:glycosyltransferase involved in cell wall biosynthesis